MLAASSPVTDEDPLTVWVHEPPEQCPNGHPWTAAIRAYRESWYGCWCSNAEVDGDPRPGHLEFTDKTCSAIVLVPTCSEPSLKVGWAASHAH